MCDSISSDKCCTNATTQAEIELNEEDAVHNSDATLFKSRGRSYLAVSNEEKKTRILLAELKKRLKDPSFR